MIRYRQLQTIAVSDTRALANSAALKELVSTVIITCEPSRGFNKSASNLPASGTAAVLPTYR